MRIKSSSLMNGRFGLGLNFVWEVSWAYVGIPPETYSIVRIFCNNTMRLWGRSQKRSDRFRSCWAELKKIARKRVGLCTTPLFFCKKARPRWWRKKAFCPPTMSSMRTGTSSLPPTPCPCASVRTESGSRFVRIFGMTRIFGRKGDIEPIRSGSFARRVSIY